MKQINASVKFLITLGRTQSILSHRLDRDLNGLSFSEFLILYYLGQEPKQTMRRIDLAAKIGMTASGVTRLLLPMEKVHLVKSGEEKQDARVRLVQLTSAGKEKLDEAMEDLQFFAEDIIPNNKIKEVEKISEFLIAISGKALII